MKTISLARLARTILIFCALAQFGLVAQQAVSNGTATAKRRDLSQAANKASIHAAGRGNPWVNLLDGHEVQAVYAGTEYAKQEIEQNQVKPLALAQDDFDEDGVPDLVCGYASSSGGLLTLHPGNVDAIYPDTPEARQRKVAGTFTDSPFLSAAFVFEVPEAVDFIAAGDFDNDGHRDILTAARGSRALYLLTSDGKGDFAPAKVKQLPGAVTALVCGEINRRDGLGDFVVGITGAQGPQVLVFESPEGAWRGGHEVFSAPAEVTSLAIGQLDDDYFMEIAIAAGHDLIIVHGRDRRLSLDESQRTEVPPAIIHQQGFPFSITAMTIAAFSGNQKTDLALLCTDGKARILHRTDRVIRQNSIASSGQVAGKQISHRSHAERWQVASQIAMPASGQASAAASLVRARVSGQPADDLLVIDRSNRQLHILTDEPTTAAVANRGRAPVSQGFRIAASLEIEGEPVAALPMRLNADALGDLVVLRGSPNGLAVALTAPMAVFTVNSTGDGADCNPADGICSTGTIDPNTGMCVLTGECTLRAAIQQANASGGADAVVFSVASIVTNSPLPSITNPITIDGSSMGRATLRGSNLSITAGSSMVRGMATLIALSGNGSNIIEDNYMGTDVSGTIALSNGSGLQIIQSSNNLIGGTAPFARNLVSGNSGHGIAISGSNATGNLVQSNFIGTDVTGTADLGNLLGVGLHSGAANNTIGPDNIISGNNASGIEINSIATNNIIQGNYIGTDVNGSRALGNSLSGVLIQSTSNNTVGGTVSGGRNIISGNIAGIGIAGSNSRGNLVQGNFIGTDVNGRADIGNTDDGVNIEAGASNNTIGGAGPEARNIISGNNSDGVEFNGNGGAASTDNTVQGNFIGTDFTGSSNLRNAAIGVNIKSASAISIVSNIVAFNQTGVSIASGIRNAVRFNSIFSNTGLGIDVGGNGVTVNDPGDLDSGPNNLQNFPVLTSVSSFGGSTTLQGTLNSTANSSFTLDFYSNNSCDASGFGEGAAFIGSAAATTDATGNVSFSITLPGALSPGQIITATATDAADNTSEFSQCKIVTSAPPTFHLSVLPDGKGSIISLPTGIICPIDCDEDYPSGTIVTLTPLEAPDSKFDGWEGDCSGKAPCTLSMTADRIVRARFVAKQQFTLTVTVGEGGTVSSLPGGFNCSGPQTCTKQFDKDEMFSLIAMPVPGWDFAGWVGLCIGNLGPCLVTMDNNKSVSASFRRTGGERVTNPIGNPQIPIQFPLSITYVLRTTPQFRASFRTDVIDNVKIELSRDNGSTFETLFANTPDDGSECWTVTGPITTRALIRVSSLSNPSITATSEQPFTIIAPLGGTQPVGSTACGGLSTSDQRSQIKGSSFHADRYSFSGVAGQPVAITLASTAFDTYLALIDPNGAVIAQDNNGGGGTDARIPAGSGFFILPASGVYTIEVTSATANATGDYLFSLSTPAPALASLQLLLKNKPVDHLVAGIKAKKYQLNLTGSGFTADSTVLINGTVVETSLPSSTTLTARLPFKHVPDPGTLTVQVLNPDGQLTSTLTIEIRNN